MSHFIGTMLGLGVEEKDEVLAERGVKVSFFPPRHQFP